MLPRSMPPSGEYTSAAMSTDQSLDQPVLRTSCTGSSWRLRRSEAPRGAGDCSRNEARPYWIADRLANGLYDQRAGDCGCVRRTPTVHWRRRTRRVGASGWCLYASLSLLQLSVCICRTEGGPHEVNNSAAPLVFASAKKPLSGSLLRLGGCCGLSASSDAVAQVRRRVRCDTLPLMDGTPWRMQCKRLCSIASILAKCTLPISRTSPKQSRTLQTRPNAHKMQDGNNKTASRLTKQSAQPGFTE